MGQLKIEMLGTAFTIQANEDNEYLEKLLGYYKRITDDVNKIDSIKNSLQTAILSGIMICDELYKEKEVQNQIKKFIPELIKVLVLLLALPTVFNYLSLFQRLFELDIVLNL